MYGVYTYTRTLSRFASTQLMIVGERQCYPSRFWAIKGRSVLQPTYQYYTLYYCRVLNGGLINRSKPLNKFPSVSQYQEASDFLAISVHKLSVSKNCQLLLETRTISTNLCYLQQRPTSELVNHYQRKDFRRSSKSIFRAGQRMQMSLVNGHY